MRDHLNLYVKIFWATGGDIISDLDVYDYTENSIICLNKMMRLYTYYARRSMYQCTKCGRIFLEDCEGKLHCFVPEEHVNKSLLTSVEGRAWEGLLYAEWKDVKPEWSEHHGYIDIKTNESYDNQVFDDREALFRCYYELFDELRQKNLIRSARLHENGKCIHSWLKKKE